MLFRTYTTTLLNQIFFTTCFSSAFSLVWLLTTSQLASVTEFIGRHPQVVQDVFVLSVASCVSQFAISYTILCFGAVTLASIMTFRQFLSVVLSCFLFGTPLSLVQWFGVLLVLTPVAMRVHQEVKQPEILTGHGGGGLIGGANGSRVGTDYNSIEDSPRPGLGGAPLFSLRSTARRDSGSANFGIDGSAMPDERTELLHGQV